MPVQSFPSRTLSPYPLSFLCSAKLAAVTSERVVYLFDDNGEKKDKFRTKPADQNSNPNFVVRSMAFSPDSTRLAIAQSDNIVFVYRWVFVGACQEVFCANAQIAQPAWTLLALV